MESHRLKSGKEISYKTYGKPDGEPLFYFHGFPGSHHEIDLFNGDELAKKNNIRLIAVDRPGYGNSDFIRNRRLLDWPDIIISIADHLKIEKFSIFGCSGGSPYALSCAHKIPDRIKTIGLISGMAPFNAPGMKKSLSSSIPKAPGFLQTFILNKMRKMLKNNPEKLITTINKSISIPDKEVMENPEIKATFIDVLKESIRNGNKGVKTDAKIYSSNWGFKLGEIEEKIFLWHGEKDENVKLISGKYVSEQLQNCDSKFFPEEGHFSLLINYSEKIFERFVRDFDKVKNLKMEFVKKGFPLFFLLLIIACSPMKNNSTQMEERMINGTVAAGFEPVKKEFVRNFTERGEIGASCCIYYKGEKVVDLWGGLKDKKSKDSWKENTVVKVFSTTKGMALLVLVKLHSEGLLEYNEKVSTYWPEFAKNGKEDITVEQLVTHKSGLVLLDRSVKVSELNNFEELSQLLENSKPMWEPGKKHGYHSASIGLFLQQLVLRVDKKGRTVGQYFEEEIARPLNADFYIGLPEGFDKNRLAKLKELVPPLALFQLKKVPKGMLGQLLNPWSLMMKSFSLIKIDLKDPLEELRFEEASGAGVGEARALARIYSDISMGGDDIGISPESMKYLIQRTVPPSDGLMDEVMRIRTSGNRIKWSSSGHCKPSDDFDFGPESCFGFYGTGGSFAFADPGNQIGYAYTMNKMDFYTQNDPREIALRETMYKCISSINKKLKDQ